MVSNTARQDIQNFLAATAASNTTEPDKSSDDTDDELFHNLDVKAGNMELVRQTLAGMSTRSAEEGVQAMGRHARTIRLGKRLWQSPPLEPHIAALIEERFWDGSFPAMKELKAAVASAKNPLEERPAPFAGNTLPSAKLTTIAYGQHYLRANTT